jgi:hypothetical protein
MKANEKRVVIEEPRLARLIFADTRFGWLWLPLRLYLGWAWWEAGWHKFVDPKWMGTEKLCWSIGFIMAGSASTNGMLFAIATWLVLAWRNAGWIGLDRWLLPAIGTPWKPGRVFHKPAVVRGI